MDFDVRGIVHLHGEVPLILPEIGTLYDLRVHGRSISDSQPVEFPKAVRAIPIRRRARILHFLHGVAFAAMSQDKFPELVRFVLHYANGEERTIEMHRGRDLVDWQFDSAGANAPINSEVVWTGSNPFVERDLFRQSGRKIRLLKSSRANPMPEVEITALDYLSVTDAAPFLIAITVE